MTSLTQSYPLKLPQDTTLRHQLDLLRDLALQAAQQLLEALWSNHWIEVFGLIELLRGKFGVFKQRWVWNIDKVILY